jgi:hypothetical protein
MKKALFILILLRFFSLNIFGDEIKISPGADLKAYRRLVVIDFKDADGSPGSGRVVSKFVASELKKKGFEILEGDNLKDILENQSNDLSPSQIEKIRERLNVDGIVFGRVIRYESSEAGGVGYYHRPADIRQAQFPTLRILFQISIEMKIVDSKDGSLLAEGKEEIQEIKSGLTIEDMAKKTVKNMLKEIPKIR